MCYLRFFKPDRINLEIAHFIVAAVGLYLTLMYICPVFCWHSVPRVSSVPDGSVGKIPWLI